MRILNLGAPSAFVHVRLIRQIALVELGVDVLAGLLDRRIRHAHGVGAHVGDEADRPLLSQLHAFVQLLGGAHRASGREAKLLGRFLLHRARRKGRRRLAAALAGRDRRHYKRQLFDFGDDGAGCRFGFDLRLMSREFLQPGLERLAVLLEVGGHCPVFLRDELPDFLLALDDQPQCDGLHPTRRQAGLDALPEHRRGLVADQAVEDAPRLLGVDFPLIDIEGVGQGFGDRVLGDLVEQNAADLAVAVAVQLRRHMPGDRFTFAVGVGRQQHAIGRVGRLLDLGEGLRLFLNSDVLRREVIVDVDAQLALGQVA